MALIQVERGYVNQSHVTKIELTQGGKARLALAGQDEFEYTEESYFDVIEAFGTVVPDASGIQGLMIVEDKDGMVSSVVKVPVVAWRIAHSGPVAIYADGISHEYWVYPNGQVDSEGAGFPNVEDYIRYENEERKAQSR